MISYSVYDNNGKILKVYTVTEEIYNDMINNNTPEHFVLGCADIFKDYVKDGKILKRELSPITRDNLKIKNIPPNSKLTIDNKQYDITDDSVDLSFNFTGTYLIKVECFPYLDYIDEITI